jgi:hypothetical protein
MKILLPPSDKETFDEFSKMTSEEILLNSIKHNYLIGINIAIEKGVNLNYVDNNGWTAGYLKEHGAK